MNKFIYILVLFFTVIYFPAYGTAEGKSAVPVSPKVKILLVPGHDDKVWGTRYGNLKEADMTLYLATEIFNLLKKDERFDVHITRDSNGYTKEFADYFKNKEENIIKFRNSAKDKTNELITNGDFISKTIVPHVAVDDYVSLRLYGINKWANENKVDAVLHVHFNDYHRKGRWIIGKYKGIAVYTPEAQLSNSKASLGLATEVFSKLNTAYKVSNYDNERLGVVPDQKLIALGSNRTLNANVRSVLVEYGYIYEKAFRDFATRHKAYTKMAGLTRDGITRYFFK